MNIHVLDGGEQLDGPFKMARKMAAKRGGRKGGARRGKRNNASGRKAVARPAARQRRTGANKGFSQCIPTKGAAKGRPVNGFSRVYANNKPGSAALNGFSRVNQQTAAQLQGHYALGDQQDLEEWEYLMNIEHPIVLDGFPNFVLQGKKERAARKAKRAAKKSTRKQTRATKKTARQAPRKARQEERGQHKTRRKEARTAKKETRAAKKEERLLKRQDKREQRNLNQEARRDRKQSRIDKRAENKAGRQEGRNKRVALRREGKDGRSGKIAEAFSNIGEGAVEVFANLKNNDGGFDVGTASDYLDYLPEGSGGGFSNMISTLQDMDPEDALDYGEDFEAPQTRGAEDPDADEGKKDNTMLLVGGAALAALALSGGLGGKKKKKK